MSDCIGPGQVRMGVPPDPHHPLRQGRPLHDIRHGGALGRGRPLPGPHHVQGKGGGAGAWVRGSKEEEGRLSLPSYSLGKALW